MGGSGAESEPNPRGPLPLQAANACSSHGGRLGGPCPAHLFSRSVLQQGLARCRLVYQLQKDGHRGHWAVQAQLRPAAFPRGARQRLAHLRLQRRALGGDELQQERAGGAPGPLAAWRAWRPRLSSRSRPKGGPTLKWTGKTRSIWEFERVSAPSATSDTSAEGRQAEVKLPARFPTAVLCWLRPSTPTQRTRAVLKVCLALGTEAVQLEVPPADPASTSRSCRRRLAALGCSWSRRRASRSLPGGSATALVAGTTRYVAVGPAVGLGVVFHLLACSLHGGQALAGCSCRKERRAASAFASIFCSVGGPFPEVHHCIHRVLYPLILEGPSMREA